MYQYNFQKLDVYQLSKNLAAEIYKLTGDFPSTEKFGLTNQIRRASVSVSLNIAEGTSRFSPKEKRRFIEIAYGSLMEVVACLDIAVTLNFITQESLESKLKLINELSNKLNALKRSYQ